MSLKRQEGLASRAQCLLGLTQFACSARVTWSRVVAVPRVATVPTTSRRVILSPACSSAAPAWSPQAADRESATRVALRGRASCPTTESVAGRRLDRSRLRGLPRLQSQQVTPCPGKATPGDRVRWGHKGPASQVREADVPSGGVGPPSILQPLGENPESRQRTLVPGFFLSFVFFVFKLGRVGKLVLAAKPITT